MTLAIAPYKYEDFIKICGECFVDDISGLTASMFVNSKVCCPCTNKLYANKYTFIHQHCKTKKHISWLAELSQNKDSIIKTSLHRAYEIKQLRIKLATQENKNKRLEKMIGEISIKENNTSIENDEMKTELRSLKEHISDITNECSSLKKHNKELLLKVLKFEAWIKYGVTSIMDLEWNDNDNDNDNE